MPGEVHSASGRESYHGTEVHKTHAGGFDHELHAETRDQVEITVDGDSFRAFAGEWFIDFANRELRDRLGEAEIPQVCYHRQLGPIQTCDTCLVEINGTLVRACSTKVKAGMRVQTKTELTAAAQKEAFDRILGQS